MRYIKEEPPVDALELDAEQKFQLLLDAVDLLDKQTVLNDIIGNRTMAKNHKAIDAALLEYYGAENSPLAKVRLRWICSRPWEEGTDNFFLTLKKEWYWLRLKEERPGSLFNRGQLKVVSVVQLQWTHERDVEKGGRESKNIFHTLLLCIGSIMGEEYEARQARADRIRRPLETIMGWASRSEHLKWGE